MLSYRHAFHAGNHADVLKHYVLSLVLDYFNQKLTPYTVVDTHAGAGLYALNDAFAQKNAEFETGIARLITAKNLPESLQQFVQIIQSFNTENNLNFYPDIYPGSPKIIEHFLRPTDKLRLFELHPNDHQLLANNFSNKNRQTTVTLQDGFNGLKACLPPISKRGIVLIDPPYEIKDDYQRVVDCIKDSLSRFATGTYCIWYPLLQRPEPALMVEKLMEISAKWMQVELSVQMPNMNGFGMHGSGMFIINPPYILPDLLDNTLPVLTKILELDGLGSSSIVSKII